MSIVMMGLRHPVGRPWSHRDLQDTPDDGNRYEIIDGELFVTPAPMTLHQEVVSELVAILRPYARSTDAGKIFTSGLKVVLAENSVVEPDVVFVAKHRLSNLRADGYYGPPEMVVEVLSSNQSLDTKVKRAKYARARVPYYWIVDSKARILSEYRLVEGAYVLQAQPTGDEEFRPLLFPGLVIPLGPCWDAPI